MTAQRAPSPAPVAAGWLQSFHPNPARWTIAATFFITFIVAALLRSPLLFLMESTCIAVAGLALGMRHVGLAVVQCELIVPPRVTEGEIVDWVVRLSHGGRLPVFSLQSRFELGEWVQAVAAEGESEESGAAPILGGVMGVLLPGDRMEYRGRLRFTLRGRHSAGQVTLISADPLGLWQVSSARALAPATLVLPRRIRLGPPTRLWSAPAPARAARGAALVAEGGEFRGTRDYAPGDPLRRIHWKWTAHGNEYRVIEFEEESGGSVALLLDLDPRVHAGRGPDSTLECAVRIVASLAEHFACHGQKAAVVLTAGAHFRVHEVTGLGGLQELLTALALVRAESQLAIGAVAELAAPRLARAAALVVVSPASAEELEGVRAQLARRGHAVMLLALGALSGGEGREPTGFEPGNISYRGSLARIDPSGDLRRQLERVW